MSTLEIALAKITILEAEVAELKAGRGSAPAASGGAGEALPDHLLEAAWADKEISRDPKQWKGPTQVGRMYSRAPADWLRMAAGNADFKAQKGREEVPVRMSNKVKDGKPVPWYESDLFEAKLLRAWANRNANKPAPAPKPKGGDDDFNFGANG